MRRPIISVAGITSSALNEESRSFSVTASPFTRLNKDQNVPSNIVSTVTIPNTMRWVKLPPISHGGHVTVEGHGVSVTRDADGFPASLNLELEKVTLQGKATMPPIPAPLRKLYVSTSTYI